MANNTLTYIINLDGNLTKGVLNISGAATKASSAMEKLHNKANMLANVGFAFQHIAGLCNKVTSAFSGCVQAYEAQSVAEKKLETLMRNTAGATNEQIQSIKDLASAQQKLGVVGTDVQLSGAQELSTYITKTESLQTLIPVMNDMLAQQYGLNASQEQAVTIAQMMGKVLDGQTGALSRYGYSFDTAQEKVLKYGSESQKTAMLAQVLTKYVGGVNRALASTPEGKWKQHQNDIGDLQVRIGKLFTEIRGSLYPMFNSVGEAIGRLTAFFERNRTQVMELAETVGKILAGAFNGLVSVIKFAVDHWKLLSAACAVWAAYLVLANLEFIKFAISYHLRITLMDRVTKIFTVTVNRLRTVINTLSKHPFVLLAAAIVAAGAAIWKCYSAQQRFENLTGETAAKIGIEQRELNGLFEALKKTNPKSEERKRLLQEMNEKYPGFLDLQKLETANENELEAARKKANDELARGIMLQKLKDTQGTAMEKITAAQQKVFETFQEKFSSDEINAAMDKVGAAVQNVIDSDKFKSGAFSGARKSLIETTISDALENSGIGSWVKQGMFKGSNAYEWYDLVDTMLENQQAVHKLSQFAQERYGIAGTEINSFLTGNVNKGLTTPGGNGNLVGTASNEAVATGGTRNTTVNIAIGNMVKDMNFNGGISENREAVRREVEQVMAQALGIAETSS